MSAIADNAVVLTRLDYSETSQVLVFFTREHGKVRAIGKGLRRGTRTRFATGIDLLEVGRLIVSARQERSATLANLTEWKQTLHFAGLRARLPRLHAALYTAEITATLTEDWDPHPCVYDALVYTWSSLAQADAVLTAVVGYQWVLLDEIGSLPRFESCVRCNRTIDLTHFSSFEGGMICRHCEPGQVEKREVSTATGQVLHAIPGWAGLESGPGVFPLAAHGTQDGAVARPVDNSNTALVGAFSTLDYHLAHLMGRQPRLTDKLVCAVDRRRP